MVDVGYKTWLGGSRTPVGGNENAAIADLLLLMVSIMVHLLVREDGGLARGHICSSSVAGVEVRGCYAGERGVDAGDLVEHAVLPDAE